MLVPPTSSTLPSLVTPTMIAMAHWPTLPEFAEFLDWRLLPMLLGDRTSAGQPAGGGGDFGWATTLSDHGARADHMRSETVRMLATISRHMELFVSAMVAATPTVEAEGQQGFLGSCWSLPCNPHLQVVFARS